MYLPESIKVFIKYVLQPVDFIIFGGADIVAAGWLKN